MRALVVVILLLAPTAIADWPMEHTDPAATGYLPGELPEWGDVAWHTHLDVVGPNFGRILGDTAYFVGHDANDPQATSLWKLGIDDMSVTKVMDLPEKTDWGLSTDGALWFVPHPTHLAAYPFNGGAAVWDWPFPIVAGRDNETFCRSVPTEGSVFVECTTDGGIPDGVRSALGRPCISGCDVAPATGAFAARVEAASGRPLWTWSYQASDSLLSRRSADPAGAGQATIVGGGLMSVVMPYVFMSFDEIASTRDVTTSPPGGGREETTLWALDAASGHPLYRLNSTPYVQDTNDPSHIRLENTQRDLANIPTGTANVVYWKSDSQLLAINPARSNTLWSYDIRAADAAAGGDAATGLGFDPERNALYAESATTLLKFDLATQQPAWSIAALPPRPVADANTSIHWQNLAGIAHDGSQLLLVSVEEHSLPAGASGIVADPTVSFGGKQASSTFPRTWLTSYDAADGSKRWSYECDVSPPYDGDDCHTYASHGVALVLSPDGNVTVLGHLAGSLTARAKPSTLYPAVKAPVSVDLSRTSAGTGGPATRFRAEWGDGSNTSWQDSPVLTHTFTRVNHSVHARVYAMNDAGQTSSAPILFDVGGSAPSFLDKAFSPDRQNITFGLIGLAATGAGGIIAILARQRRRSVLARELAALEELRARTKGDERAWILGIEEKRGHHAALLRKRRIDSGELLVLERRIEVLSLMASAPSAIAEIGATLLGRYRLDRVLGEGGQGRAFLARDELIGRDVVVKTVRTQGLGGDARRALLAEARLAGSIDHPNVVRVLDVVDGPSEAYLILEYVEGGTLRALMRRGPMPRAESLRIARGILAGLAAAHARGVVHGDIKPENVLLARDGTPKLADFGTARETATEATIGAIPTGTLRYMAPEQVRGRPADVRSDLYAATAILAEMLTGAPLMGHAPLDDFQMRAKILDGALDLTAAPEDLRPVLARGLAGAPERRYQSASELVEALAS